MKQVNYYKVAEHIFSIKSHIHFSNYSPFIIDAANTNDTAFNLNVLRGSYRYEFIHELTQDDEGQQIVCGHTKSKKPVFEFWLNNQKAGTLICSNGYVFNTLYVTQEYDRDGCQR